jgi:hypothetical protein
MTKLTCNARHVVAYLSSHKIVKRKEKAVFTNENALHGFGLFPH